MCINPFFKHIAKLKNSLIVCCFASVFSASVYSNEQDNVAEHNTANLVAEEQELSIEIENLKEQVLQLNRDLFILEEDILFPASTQLAVFVSLDIGQFFKIDSVELKLNGYQVAGFLYTDRQRNALEQGGIQRIYVGNLLTGEHRLTALFIGKDNRGRDVKRAVTYQFEKHDEAVMIELKILDNTTNYKSEVVVEEWVL